MQVTTPKAWLALAACGAVVLAGLMWSVFGELPTTVSGHGILIKEGGVFVATSRGEGSVEELSVDVRSVVQSNRPLAKISQPELKLRIEQAEKAEERLTRELAALLAFHEKERSQEARDLQRQRELY